MSGQFPWPPMGSSDWPLTLDQLVGQAASTLTSRLGIGTSHAAQFLISAGQNADRPGSESAFARLCGVAPIPISSGKTHRMRLHREADRQANRALHLIAVCRLRYDPKTITYMERRRAEGLSKKDVSAASNASSPERSSATSPLTSNTLDIDRTVRQSR